MTNLSPNLESLNQEIDHDLERLRKLDRPIDPFDSGDCSDPAITDDMVADEGDHSGNNFDLFDPAFFGVDAADWPVDPLDDQDPVDGPSLDLKKLDQAEKRYLPFARKREGRQVLKKITIEDFDSREERIAFLAIEKHKTDLFGHKATTQNRKTAIEWFFAHADDGGLTFNVCAALLDSRPDVLRLRIHYEFWLRWMVFSEEFPFMTVPIPEIIRGEILYNSNMHGVEVAQEAWLQPGLSTEALLMKASGAGRLEDVPSDYKKAVDLLETCYILSIQHEGWYLTGRNPLLQRLDQERERGRNIASSSIHWSRLFFTPNR